MKVIHLLFVTLIIVTPLTTVAQKSERNYNAIKILSSQPQPHFVFKANDQTLEIPSTSEERVDLSILDPNSIASIHVLKNQEAIEQYGTNGKNGVIIISFKEFDKMPQSIQDKFNNTPGRD
jgi:hypothetical protein